MQAAAAGTPACDVSCFEDDRQALQRAPTASLPPLWRRLACRYFQRPWMVKSTAEGLQASCRASNYTWWVGRGGLCPSACSGRLRNRPREAGPKV